MAAPAPPLPLARAAGDGGGDLQGGAGAEARRAVKALLFLAAVALPCLVLYRAVAPGGGAAPWRLTAAARNDVDRSSEDARLERVLRAAAMANDTVILTTLNSAWSAPGSVVDVFLESFRIGESTRELLDHLVIVSLDNGGARALQADSPPLLRARHRRRRLLRPEELHDRRLPQDDVAQDRLPQDTDIVWFRNPVPHFYPDGDFQIACDHFTGDPDDLLNTPNGGFAYARSNAATIEFYRFWYAARERHPGLHDQDVLNSIKRDTYLAELGVRIKFLSTDLFGGLCEPSRNMSRVCTMHANCCIGLSRKINDLNAMLRDWRRFMSMPHKYRHYVSWTVPQNCSLGKLEE
ncbi:hypothetical protein ACP70R_017016 [Stipagrostis hirtigluma subsp. patula]